MQMDPACLLWHFVGDIVMKSKTLVYLAGAFLVLLFVTVACSSGFILGRLSTPSPVPVFETPPIEEQVQPTQPEPTNPPQASSPKEELVQPVVPTEVASERESRGQVDTEELFKPFWETWEIIENQYVDQPLDSEELMRGAIRGMLEALGDQHTSYMDPDQFRQANIPLEQEYEGIGAWVDTTAEYLTIVTPMPGSPAENAGLKPGDQVIAIDGDDMTGIDGNLVIRRVLGPAGSSVRLTIQRPGLEGTEPEIFDVDIVRARINIPSVEGEILEDGIAYLKLFQFSENTRSEMRKVLGDLMAQNPKGLILDLRNNGGGYLTTSIEVASEFISSGTILIEEYGDGRRDVYTALSGGLATEIPLVVLVNEGSASASEIVAGAIQDYGRAPLVGTTSFGKGSVQNWVPLSEGQGAVRVTIARWLTPTERQIHGVGLAPDVEVPLTEEDIHAEHDPQLDKAIEILSNQ
jgi:carboxyl-terminal processing protease